MTNATDLHISYENRQISSIHSTAFLGLVIDNLSWNCHIDQMIPKLNKAAYVIRSLKPLSFESLKMVYFSTVHSIISYGIIFWGISTHRKIIFKIQKRVIRLLRTQVTRILVEIYLKNYIFSLSSLNTYFLYSCLLLRIKTFSKWTHSFNTRSHYYLHIPAANLALFQKWVWYSGIKIYNHLPPSLKQLSYDISKFKAALKRLLLQTLFTHWRSIIAGNKYLGSYYYILTIL